MTAQDNLAGKVILVTGAASGIGAAAVRLIRARGGTAVASDLAGSDIRLDVAEPDEWDAAVTATVARHGRLDGLVLSAGIASHGALVDLDLEEFRRTARINVEGNFLGMQRAVAQFRAQGTPAQGSIVVVSSVMGIEAAAGTASYGATKAALSNMARAVGVELGRKGDFIRVNVVAPGPVATPMLRGTMTAQAFDDPTTWADVPLGSPSDADDIAETIAFLLSDDAGFMTSSVTTVDGGWSLT